MILRGNIELNATDVSDTFASLTFMGDRDSIKKRATYGQNSSFAGGDTTYEAGLDLNQGVEATDASMIFYDALADVEGTVTVSGTFKPGPVSPTNPKFTGIALVTEFEIGGEVNTEGTSQFTFPLLARPVRSVAP